MKFLILRFSSIGDIVLTTPVIRALANAGHEVHFVTKDKFKMVLENNPNINKLFTFKNEITEIDNQLKSENYDYIIDLHHNLRTKRLIAKLRKPVRSFNKLNYEKWLRVYLRMDILPPVHIVDRYMDTLSQFDLKYDGKGLDYYISNEDDIFFLQLGLDKSEDYSVFVVGGAHFTKQIPKDIFVNIANKSNSKIVLVGGNDDIIKAEEIKKELGDNCIDLCGQLSLNQSAAVVKYARNIITADTGLMHIAAAFDRNIIALWGNTIPEFGMTALLPNDSNSIVYNAEVKGLRCRPCSKIGFNKCPKKHFNCMLQQDVEGISLALK